MSSRVDQAKETDHHQRLALSDATATFQSPLPNHKLEMVFSLLSMLNTQSAAESSKTLLRMSLEAENCTLLRHCGCLKLIIRMLHPTDWLSRPSEDEDVDVLERAGATLRNIVSAEKDGTIRERQLKILHCLERIRLYVLGLRFERTGFSRFPCREAEKETLSAVVSIMKWSFDEQNRRSTCLMGGLEAVCDLLTIDQLMFGAEPAESHLFLRRYIGMTLTNLTYGAVHCKRMLCSSSDYLKSISLQLQSTEDLKQVYASVLRNLSWKADLASQAALRSNSTAELLIKAALEAKRETTVKSILSALWNVTSHCEENQAEVCNVPQALSFLFGALKRSCAAKNTAIIENCGGIIRNVAASIGAREDFRRILREEGCLELFVEHLKSDNVTMVSNACGILWSLASGSVQEQEALCKLGAAPLLKGLSESKHVLIRLASVSTLKILRNYLMSRSAPGLPDQQQQGCPTDLSNSRDRTLVRRRRNGSDSPEEMVSSSPPVGSNLLYMTVTKPSALISTAQDMRCNPSAFGDVSLTEKVNLLTDMVKGGFVSPPESSYSEGGSVDARKQESMETLKRFAFEGTPVDLSHRSSLSSIYAALFQEEQPVKSPLECEAKRNGEVESKEGDVFSPVVFSRHSSVQSLNSCELHSVHSTVYSEYSCYPTALVSPSDLPDSPSQSVLPSPFPEAAKTTAKDVSEVEPVASHSNVALESPMAKTSTACRTAAEPSALIGDDVFDLPRVYQNEGSSRGELSSASSLSALTIDVETKVKPLPAVNDMLDLKSCIRSAQPSRSASSKDVSAFCLASKNRIRRNDKYPFLGYQKTSADGYEAMDEIVKRYADEGSVSLADVAAKSGVPRANSGTSKDGSKDEEFASTPVTDIHSVINMAMPRPKAPKADGQHASAAVAKGNQRPALKKTTKVQLKELNPSQTGDQTEEARGARSELRECIYSAFPKRQFRKKPRTPDALGKSLLCSKTAASVSEHGVPVRKYAVGLDSSNDTDGSLDKTLTEETIAHNESPMDKCLSSAHLRPLTRKAVPPPVPARHPPPAPSPSSPNSSQSHSNGSSAAGTLSAEKSPLSSQHLCSSKRVITTV